MSRFPWVARAGDLDKAWQVLKISPRDPLLIARFADTAKAAFPPEFFKNYNMLKNGDVRGVDMIIEYLEADPWCFRSGYIKADLAKLLKRVRLSKTQVRRLENVLLKIVDERNTEEFRNYCRLARVIATPALIGSLRERLTNENIYRRLRASWMLSSIEQKLKSHKS